MKRVFTLAIAAALMLGTVCTASAGDVKIKGQWDFAFGWADNIQFHKHGEPGAGRNSDPFIARQRVRTQVDFIASENLSGTLVFEIGDLDWGRARGNSGRSSGGALDGDGVNIETKRAYLDWMVPGTDLSIRMGLQGLALPSATGFGNPVFNDDVAGVVASYKVNNTVGLTAFWVRPFDAYENDFSDGKSSRNLDDEMDIFGLLMPLTFDGFKVTPWATYAQIGGTSGFWDYRISNHKNYGGANNFDGDTEAWWAGTAFELTLFNPLTFGMDVMYGDVHGNSGPGNDIFGGNPGSRGWFADARLDYKMSWGTPGIFGWWASGDSANDVHDGKYGRMPVVAPDSGFAPTTFGFDGSAGIGSDGIMTRTGVGTWGAGLQFANMSFIENLSHTIRVAYYQGTNDNEILLQAPKSIGIFGERMYLTDKDSAIEVNFDHKYQIYENLAAYLELGYLHLNMDDSWQNSYRGTEKTSDAWKAQVLFQYKF